MTRATFMSRVPRSRRRHQRRAYCPMLEVCEDRTLLASMLWTNVSGGDWDLASNWVNSGDSTDHHVPIATDDAIIGLDGVSVTHVQGDTDSVNSLSITSTTASLNVSNGSLAIAAASSISGSLTISGGTFDYSGSNVLSTGALTQTGGTLTGTGTVNVSGLTTWSGGSMTGSGVTNADGGLALGGTAAYNSYSMTLDQRTFNNDGAALLSSGGNYSSALYLSSGALFDNQAAGSFTFTDDNTSIVNGGGTPAGGTFENDGTLIKQGSTGSSVIGSGITFNDLGAATLTVSSARCRCRETRRSHRAARCRSPPARCSTSTLGQRFPEEPKPLQDKDLCVHYFAKKSLSWYAPNIKP